MINLIIAYSAIALLLLFCVSIIFSVLSFAPWVPSRSRDLKRIFKIADLKSGQVFYDLGCGNGKIVFYAAKNYKAKAIGLEISLPFYFICILRQVFTSGLNIKFKLKNLYKENLSSADTIFFFGTPWGINPEFKTKLKTELKPGTKIISYSFSLTDWTPVAVDKPGEKDLPIYLYII
jgi:SAM-dependent methyltransferase